MGNKIIKNFSSKSRFIATCFYFFHFSIFHFHFRYVPILCTNPNIIIYTKSGLFLLKNLPEPCIVRLCVFGNFFSDLIFDFLQNFRVILHKVDCFFSALSQFFVIITEPSACLINNAEIYRHINNAAYF